MKNLFIDTNIWLSLYSFSDDDLEQFEKLKDRIGNDIRIIIPTQVKDEITRNREAKLNESFSKFEMGNLQFPTYCKSYSEYEGIRKDYINLKKRFDEWKKAIKDDIIAQNLAADSTISSFFERAGLVNCNEFVEKGALRYRIGNPPGKDNKYGDAINWECLLSAINDGEDLYFISGDKDYKSTINPGMINPFLAAEWKEKKKSKIYFYTSLLSFLNEHFSDIKLQNETKKAELIAALAESPNFITTHSLIGQLNKCMEWSQEQVEQLCRIAKDNDQVGWILLDEDVRNFYVNLLEDVVLFSAEPTIDEIWDKVKMEQPEQVAASEDDGWLFM